ncbi:hypothetical protein SynBIOSE41_01718 [Synechococcus sp. BIOS-E4-1]|nr:hypothetical protein SynBIOSE41_01718 [Synechococcus sp. BIOS-E4-1]
MSGRPCTMLSEVDSAAGDQRLISMNRGDGSGVWILSFSGFLCT